MKGTRSKNTRIPFRQMLTGVGKWLKFGSALAQILQQLRGNYLKTVKLWEVDRASAIALTVIKGEEVLSVRVIRDQVGGRGG